MSQSMAYLTRSSGIVATVLMLAAVAWGFAFSARETGKRLRPAWWLDLHNGLGGFALIFTGIHLLTAFLASDLGVGLKDVAVPGGSDQQTGAFTWGVLAFYGLAVAVFTSWPRKRFKRRTWRLVHLLSVPATVAACVHGYQLGTDAATPAFKAGLVILVGATVYPAGMRLTGLLARRTSAER